MSERSVSAGGDASEIAVEVAFASATRQWLMRLRVPVGCTVGEAIARSGIAAHLDGLKVTDRNVGVFAQPCRLDAVLVAGDRVEIYRPLIADPKDARRERAKAERRNPK